MSDLVTCRLHCSFCQSAHSIALPGEALIRDVLLATTCPTCFRVGSMRLANPIAAATPIGKYDEPCDELGDEELHEGRSRSRSMH